MKGAVLAAAGLGAGVAGVAGSRVLAGLRAADLGGQVALVTGGSRGLGFLLARELAREGCRVAICARDKDELERASAELAREGAEILTVACDMSRRAQVERAVGDVASRFGQVDILVNNAGIITVGPVQNMTIEDFEESMNITFWGTVYATMAVLPGMLERRSGRIVNVTSIGGKVSVPHLLPYGAAKFAAVGFSEGLRAELAGTGVTVTTIAPGLMRTGSPPNAYFKGRQEREFIWFTLGDSLPFVSMDAARAARQIVAAAKRGEAERILSLPATLLARAHGLFPGTTSNVLGVVNRLILPKPGEDDAKARGMEVHERMHTPILDSLMSWTFSSARRHNEYPGPVHASGAAGSAQGS